MNNSRTELKYSVIIVDAFFVSECALCGKMHPVRVLIESGRYVDYAINCDDCINSYVLKGTKIEKSHKERTPIEKEGVVMMIGSPEGKRLEEWGLLFQPTIDLFEWM